VKVNGLFVRVNGFSVFQSVVLYLRSAVCSVWFRMQGIKSSLVACDGRLPRVYCRGQVIIGRRFVVRSRIARSEFGAALPNSLLQIGDGVFINQGVSIVAYCHIEIGDDAKIGEFASIYDTDHHIVEPSRPTKYAPVIIGTNVWLGRGVMVLPGSKIGDHTVVAAGSIVKGDLPPRVLAAGIPAQVVRELDIPEGWRRD
jgi:acetyltransferase-like isoleucine patch superfamily enzyme